MGRMPLLARVAVLFALCFLTWPSSAWACSCPMALDVRDSLKTAREEADLVFHGRVEAIQRDRGDDFEVDSHVRTTFTVLETFKGRAAPRRVITTFEDMCSYSFDPGTEYLVYAHRNEKGEFHTDGCTRTQTANKASVEMASLRGATLPLRPVAMRRQHLSCTRCDVEAVARTLVCGGAEPCAPSSGKASEAALRESRPFWEIHEQGSRERMSFGVGLDGRAFQLERPDDTRVKVACEQRVLRRGCARLSLQPPGSGPRVTCMDPSPEEPLCDESATRRASWGPVEALPRGPCVWSRADAPVCEWSPETVPLAPGAPTRPGLVCTTGPRGNMFPCRVVPDAASVPPLREHAPGPSGW